MERKMGKSIRRGGGINEDSSHSITGRSAWDVRGIRVKNVGRGRRLQAYPPRRAMM